MSFKNHVKCGVRFCAIVLQLTEEAAGFFCDIQTIFSCHHLYCPDWALCDFVLFPQNEIQVGRGVKLLSKEMRPQVFILSKNGLVRRKVFDFYDCGNFEMTDVDRKHKG